VIYDHFQPLHNVAALYKYKKCYTIGSISIQYCADDDDNGDDHDDDDEDDDDVSATHSHSKSHLQ